jgi:hypothetical protein
MCKHELEMIVSKLVYDHAFAFTDQTSIHASVALFSVSSSLQTVWSVLFSQWFMSKNRCSFPEILKVSGQCPFDKCSLLTSFEVLANMAMIPNGPMALELPCLSY